MAIRLLWSGFLVGSCWLVLVHGSWGADALPLGHVPVVCMYEGGLRIGDLYTVVRCEVGSGDEGRGMRRCVDGLE
jgi:hypothetical protein